MSDAEGPGSSRSDDDSKQSPSTLVNVSGLNVPESVSIDDDGNIENEPVRMADVPWLGSTHLRDVISSRSDIPELRHQYLRAKKIAQDMGYPISKVDELLPLTSTNDPLYVTEKNIDWAEFFADLFHELDPSAPAHTRGVHYNLLGFPVLYPKRGYDEEEGYSAKEWDYFTMGSANARYLGTINPTRLKDEKNDPPEGPYVKSYTYGNEYREKQTLPSDSDITTSPWLDTIDTSPTTIDLPETIVEPSISKGYIPAVDEILDQRVRSLTRQVFSGTKRHACSHSPVRVAVWVEKSNVLPKSRLRGRYLPDVNLTFREAGGGQFSEIMARWEVELAKMCEQDLLIVVLTDNDQQGLSMAPGVARKVALQAALGPDEPGSFGGPINAWIEHAAVRDDQIETYDLPEAPGADGMQVEINSFAERHPDEFFAAICAKIDPYVDLDLQDKLDDDVSRCRSEFRNEIEELYDEARETLEELRGEAIDARQGYLDEMGEVEEEARERTEEINEKIRELRTWYKEKNEEARENAGVSEAYSDLKGRFFEVDYQPVIDDVDVDDKLSEADIKGPVNDSAHPPLFDSRRTLGQQLDVIRYYSPDYVSIESDAPDRA